MWCLTIYSLQLGLFPTWGPDTNHQSSQVRSNTHRGSFSGLPFSLESQFDPSFSLSLCVPHWWGQAHCVFTCPPRFRVVLPVFALKMESTATCKMESVRTKQNLKNHVLHNMGQLRTELSLISKNRMIKKNVFPMCCQ